MTKPTSPEPKRIALVAHDDKKDDLLEWAEYNRDILADHILFATGTTGKLLSARLDRPSPASRAARSAATSRSARSSRQGAWTCSSSSGTR